MSARDALAEIARGQSPADGALLQNCRMEAFGSGFYGEEAILHAFGTRPCDLSAASEVVQGRSQLAVFGPDWALLADTYDGNIARIWRLGPGEPMAREPALAVPFDPDLAQARGGVNLRAADHPELPAAAVEPLRQWAHSRTGSGTTYRTRSFLIRAFADGDTLAALFAVHRLAAEPRRTPGFGYVAASFALTGGALAQTCLIEDEAGNAATQAEAWQPRL